MDDAWKTQIEGLGAFIRTQRNLAQLSLREMAALTDLSDAYLSQVERGIHEPSVRVLRAIARGLNLSASSLLAEAGLVDVETETAAPADGAAAPATESAIRSDPTLTDSQKEALLGVYRSFGSGNSGPAAQ